MRLASQFRTHAEECRKLADEATTPAGGAYWASMARVWDSLALDLEETHAVSEGSSVFWPADLPSPCPCASHRKRV